MFKLRKKKKQVAVTGPGPMVALPDQMTHRFTLNLPRGQKAVVRVSPLKTLNEVVTEICVDKGLDLRKHILQIPGKPGVPVDLGATIQQVGVHEMNLVTVGLQDRNHTVSMPDLSRPPPSADQPPTFMPSEHKKKRGFLSFLKKDKKPKHYEPRYSMETSSTTSHMMSAAQARRPPSPSDMQQRRSSDTERAAARPKSMFVTASSPADNENIDSAGGENVQSMVAPARKKRRAPAPPAPTNSQPPTQPPPSASELSAKPDRDSKDNSSQLQTTHNTTAAVAQKEDVAASAAVPSQQQQQVSRAEMLSRLHSRNSSDSSGYHELTLSGCESPEATHSGVTKHKTSIDSTSIESTDNANGDSGIHESPIRVSPIEEVQERSEVNSVSSSAPSSAPATTSQASASPDTDTLQSRKKRKAPAPPAPTPVAQSSNNVTAPTKNVSAEVANSSSNVKEHKADIKDTAHHVEKVSEPQPTATSSPSHPDQTKPVNTSVLQPVPPASAASKTEKTETVEQQKKKDVQKDDPYLADVSKDTNESTAFDINDILEGVVFDEEPRSMELKLEPRQDLQDSDRDAMMMVETSSVTSENIEQMEETTKSERPCAFIPPPPPSEPPPPEQPVVDINSITSNTGPVLVDKGTEVNDDNISLAPSSAKSSPGTAHKRRDSFTSLGSVDTIEGISLDFQQAIQMGEESMYSPLDDMEGSHKAVPTSPSRKSVGKVSPGYKSEMALFVERMSKMAVEGAEERENEQLDDSVSSLSIHGSDNNSDTGSVIQHLQSDSRSGSESGSLTRKEGMKIGSEIGELKSSFKDHPKESQETASTDFASEEITVPVETLPPPPEFGDKGSDKDENDNNDDEDEEEEFFTETVEELIIPLGPNGFDFTAAQKVSESSTQHVIEHKKEKPEVKNKNDVFRAEPVSIKPVAHAPTPIYQSQTKPAEPPAPPKQAEKEEFVLTTEDLSNVSFLPPRPQAAKPIFKPEPSVHVSSTSLVMEKRASPVTISTSKHNGNVQNKVPEINIMEEKPVSSLNMPSMRPTVHTDNVPEFSDDDRSDTSNDPLVTKLAPRLLMNSHSNGGSRKSSYDQDIGINSRPFETDHRSSVDNGADADVVDGERPGSRASAYSMDAQEQQEALQSQYYSLQSQFGQWQEQLARNQSLLASQAMGPELQSEQLQQLTNQMAMQQQMMQQLQSTMMALQQQQQQVQGNDQEHRASSGETSAKLPEPAAAAAEPAPVVAAAPPPPPPPAQQSKVVKSESNRTRQRPKPKFEPELDPREQLMIAIRSFSRGGLKSVPVQKANWVHSKR